MDGNTFVLMLLFLAGLFSVGITIRDIVRDVRGRRTPS